MIKNLLFFFPRAAGYGLRLAWCMSMPWHRWYHIKWLSEQSEMLRCRHCGRRWSSNHDVRVTLPWEIVSEFHNDRERRRVATATPTPESHYDSAGNK